MSRTVALLAILAILELGICANASKSENSASSAPVNTESISEAADAAKPAELIDSGEQNLKEEADAKAAHAVAPSSDMEPSAGASGKEAAPKKKYKAQAPKEDLDDHDANRDKSEDIEKDDREAKEQAYMSHDDSHPGGTVDPKMYYDAGCRYISMKKYQLALDAFNKALELSPRYYEASYKKALVYQLAGMDKYAARRYQDILKYKDMDEVRINLAALHRKHKHYVGAEEQLRAVLQHNWASYEARYNLANVLLEEGKLEDALKEYKMCMKMKPRDPMVHNNIGVLFLQKNYPEEALQEFRKAKELSPANQTFTANINAVQKQIAEKKRKGATM